CSDYKNGRPQYVANPPKYPAFFHNTIPSISSTIKRFFLPRMGQHHHHKIDLRNVFQTIDFVSFYHIQEAFTL
ncbi:MAG: hypothetical protein Q8923_11540, partial [Bacillota bacterium]|nr:hypothetical protein [Bacillota bacterium]